MRTVSVGNYYLDLQKLRVLGKGFTVSATKFALVALCIDLLVVTHFMIYSANTLVAYSNKSWKVLRIFRTQKLFITCINSRKLSQSVKAGALEFFKDVGVDSDQFEIHSNFDITDRQGTSRFRTLYRMYVIANVFHTIGVTNGSRIWYGMSKCTLFGCSSYRSLSVLKSTFLDPIVILRKVTEKHGKGAP